MLQNPESLENDPNHVGIAVESHLNHSIREALLLFTCAARSTLAFALALARRTTVGITPTQKNKRRKKGQQALSQNGYGVKGM